MSSVVLFPNMYLYCIDSAMKGDNALCGCLATIAAAVLLESQDWIRNGTVQASGLLDFLFKAASHLCQWQRLCCLWSSAFYALSWGVMMCQPPPPTLDPIPPSLLLALYRSDFPAAHWHPLKHLGSLGFSFGQQPAAWIGSYLQGRWIFIPVLVGID